MPTVERIETWRGADILDASGEKAGRLEEVYYEGNSTEPVVMSVKHGMLGRQLTLVPASAAVLSHDYLRVPFSAEQIEESQGGRIEDELSSEQVAAVAALFKTTLPTGPLYSATLIERRRAEAEQANQRAHELAQEKQQRAQELEEARKRVAAADEEAQAAERERQKAQAAVAETAHEPPPET